MKKKPFALVGVNSDKRERVRQAVRENGISWRSFWDGGSTGGPIAKAWGVRSWPTIYIIDAHGVIRAKNVRGQAMDAAVDRLVEEHVVKLAEQLSDDDAEVRGQAAFLLGKYDASDALEEMEPLLEDDEEVVRVRAAVGLAQLGQPAKPLLELVRRAVRDQDAEVRAAALKVLGASGDTASGALVISRLEDSDKRVQHAAMAAIGGLKLSEGLPAVAQRARDTDPVTARTAITALGEFETHQAMDSLRALVSDAPYPARIWAAVALHTADNEGTAAQFREFLGETDAAVRRDAMRALVELEDFDATDLYIRALDDSDQDVLRMARDALRDSLKPRAIAALEKSLARQVENLVGQLADRSYSKKRRARALLQELGPAVAPLLLDRMEGAPARTQMELSTVIGRLGETSVIPSVARKLANPDLDNDARRNYENILRAMRNQASETAMALAGHDDPSVRESGVRVLASCRGSEVSDMLHRALQDSSEGVRVHAAGGLARRRDDVALPTLQAAARSDNSEYRRIAVTGLALYRTSETLDVLQELVDDPDRNVRSHLLRALGNYTEPAATNAIERIMEQDKSLQIAAVYALQQQDTAEAARVLGGMLETGTPALQRRARSALQKMETPEAGQFLQ